MIKVNQCYKEYKLEGSIFGYSSNIFHFCYLYFIKGIYKNA